MVLGALADRDLDVWKEKMVPAVEIVDFYGYRWDWNMSLVNFKMNVCRAIRCTRSALGRSGWSEGITHLLEDRETALRRCLEYMNQLAEERIS